MSKPVLYLWKLTFIKLSARLWTKVGTWCHLTHVLPAEGGGLHGAGAGFRAPGLHLHFQKHVPLL